MNNKSSFSCNFFGLICHSAVTLTTVNPLRSSVCLYVSLSMWVYIVCICQYVSACISLHVSVCFVCQCVNAYLCMLTSGGSLLLGGSSSTELLRLICFSSLTRFASGGGTRFMSDSLLVRLWECEEPETSADLNWLSTSASNTCLSSHTLMILLVDFFSDSSLHLQMCKQNKAVSRSMFPLATFNYAFTASLLLTVNLSIL